MSQRGRGSGPDDDDPDGEGEDRERVPSSSPPPPASRPIAPYDPYRSSSGTGSRRSTRNVAADASEPQTRPSSSRAADDSPFLPADDPLSAEAWQLELDEVDPAGDDAALGELDFEAPADSRRVRRQPLSTRGSRAASTRAAKAPRRRSSAGATRSRATRPAVTIAMPQAVMGSSLVADQTALALAGINVVSIVLMALLLGMRSGGIPSPMVLQLDAAGNPDLWGPPSVLWRLPVMSLFITIMFFGVAWFLHPIDRFAARFALGAAFVAQLIAWAAILQHLA